MRVLTLKTKVFGTSPDHVPSAVGRTAVHSRTQELLQCIISSEIRLGLGAQEAHFTLHFTSLCAGLHGGIFGVRMLHMDHIVICRGILIIPGFHAEGIQVFIVDLLQ